MNDLQKKCKTILNKWIDGDDSDEMLEQLRSLRTCDEISEEEYDYILENWDDLLD